LRPVEEMMEAMEARGVSGSGPDGATVDFLLTAKL
jgi:hypothetical protein